MLARNQSIVLIFMLSITSGLCIAGLGPSMYPCDVLIGGESASGQLSVSIDGSPTSYQPGALHHVTLRSGVSFNILIINGVVTSPSDEKTTRCFPIHTHVSPEVTDHVTFYWIAPPTGSGCVSMRVRASAQAQIVLNDVIAYQICEEGSSSRINDHHTPGIVFKEDFDSRDISKQWTSDGSRGVSVGAMCRVMHANAAVFCNMTSEWRYLTTKSMDMRQASSLQFVLGAGSCPSSQARVRVFYRDSSMTTEWSLLKSVRAPASDHSSHVIVSGVPDAARRESVQLKFSEEPVDPSGCWAIDNVLVTSRAERPAHIEDSFGPIKTSNWLFWPGGDISSLCTDDGDNALVLENYGGPTYVTTRDVNLEEGARPGIDVTDLVETGSTLQQGACGHSDDVIVHVFDRPGPRFLCTGAELDLRGMAAASFTLGTGSGSCSRSRSHTGDVQFYFLKDGMKNVIHTFHYDSNKNPTKVVVPIPSQAQTTGTTLCLRQKSQSGNGSTWSVDSFRLVEQLEYFHHFAQFSINIGCGELTDDLRVKFQYSSDRGRSWRLVHEQCLPGTCAGRHRASASMYDASSFHVGWNRFTLPLPVSVLTEATRFRWIEVPSNVTSPWAIDDVYIGSDGECPNMCNGRGSCALGGCRCDEGYFGSACDMTNSSLPTFLSDDFDSGMIDSQLFEEVSGYEVGFSCGIVGSGKSLVFNKPGQRMLMTKQMNATGLRFLQFTILMGRSSTTGPCRPSSDPEDGVIVQYSTTGGVIWKLLHFVQHRSYHRPMVISLSLPRDAMTSSLLIRWYQTTNHNKPNRAVWAVDDVLVTSALFRSAYASSVNFHLGTIQQYCGRDSALAFTSHGPPHDRQVRYAETQSLQVAQGYVLQAEVVIGCEQSNGSSSLVNAERTYLNTTLELQYSTNHGQSWELVFEASYPGSVTSQAIYHPSSVLHASEYKKWRRVMLPLPEHTWSEGTRFRIAQYTFDDSVDSWALDDVYMGPGCPSSCLGHGSCRDGLCTCDEGYHGNDCAPVNFLPAGMDVTFDDVEHLLRSGWRIIGGQAASNDVVGSGCGPMTSSSYIHFSDRGVRKLETPDMNTTGGGQIQFYLRIGGGDCGLTQERSNGVVFQYSTDGATTWRYIQEFYHRDYPLPLFVHLDMPQGTVQPQVRFRWWQPSNRGKNRDQWSIDDVIIGERLLNLERSYDVIHIRAAGEETERDDASASKDPLFLVFSNRGQSGQFCSQRFGSHVFNKLQGDRFAMTDDMAIQKGYILQFQMNIACSTNFALAYPVVLQFSHNGGYSWDYVRHSCYPSGRFFAYDDTDMHTSEDVTSHRCTGSARELSEESGYHKGDFESWRTVVLEIPAEVAAERVRFRWLQHVYVDAIGATPPDWAISDVYIGPSCPNSCLGHGLCRTTPDGPRCMCDQGYFEELDGSCAPVVEHPAGFWDRFDEVSSWWGSILGGSIRGGCEEDEDDPVLHFAGDGTREARTVSLDTSRIRLIHFVIEIGGGSCALGEERNENVILQYSLDGVHWELIKEIEAGSHAGRRLELVDMPLRAKSRSTTFRWWQPLQTGGQDRVRWSIDDVMIGRPDMFQNGLYDDFTSSRDLQRPSEDSWYRMRGGHVGDYVACNVTETAKTRETSLVFDSDIGGSRFIETWDLFILAGTFVQFELIMGCNDNVTGRDAIDLQYSNDLGRTWHDLSPQCFPGSDAGCENGLGSRFYRDLNREWTRHTVPVADAVTSARMRFRWIQRFHTGSRWAIDNVYIGNECEWMCGGFGSCEPIEEVFTCRCDEGFQSAPGCQPSVMLKSSMTDDFNNAWSPQGRFGLVVGGDVSSMTPDEVIVSGENLRFSRGDVRMLQTLPMNTSDVRYVQFHIRLAGFRADNSSRVIVQSSVNNGISWKTHKEIVPDVNETKTFIHIKLPRSERQQATVFRWWMTGPGPVAAEDESVWAIDDLVVGGRASSCSPHVISDNLQSSDGDNWLFRSGGERGRFCEEEELEDRFGSRSLSGVPLSVASESNDAAFVFNGPIGERSLMTRDMCVTSDSYVIQFKIAIGCGDVDASSEDPVKLEFSLDDGVTWSLVLPHCHGDSALGLGCSDERHPASIYFPGSWRGWRRVVIPLRPHVGDASSVRFRWRQGFYASADVIAWAIDDVYIGPQCEQMCNGHGVCDEDGESCICDEGYEGATCCDVIEGTNPDFFMESFDEEVNSDLWLQRAGGSVTSSECDASAVFLRNRFEMTRPGSRVQMTRDIDARKATFIQFYIKFVEEGVVEAEPVHLQYSTDGGLSWLILETFASSRSGLVRYVVLALPEGARSNSTRFRFWEPSSTGVFTLRWSIDHVVVGAEVDELDEDFSTLQRHNWLELASSKFETSRDGACCAADVRCDFLHIGGVEQSARDCGRRWAATNGVKVGPGSFVHFHIIADCGIESARCHDISLEFSSDLGRTWALVQPKCLPTNRECSPTSRGSVFPSDLFKVGRRVVMPLPERTWSSSTRFRWSMAEGVQVMTWSIDDVYIGNRCPRACSGHGRCRQGTCECDDGWDGPSCRSATYALTNELKDAFETDTSDTYEAVIGAEVDDVCGNLGFRSALHFHKACSRLLVTRPLDTRGAEFVQFFFRFACTGFKPANRNQSVILHYSRNGGVTWHQLIELRHNEYDNARFVNVLLPPRAKTEGVQLRWWQPSHGGEGKANWAIDNLFVGGRREGKSVSDSFQLDQAPSTAMPTFYLDRNSVEQKQNDDMWSFYDNTQHASFCGRDDVITAGVQPNVEASILTKDFVATDGYIIQYTIVVLCQDVSMEHQPVHLQYSTDFGDSWSYVTSQCTPAQRECYGREMSQATIHFVSGDWSRRTIRIDKNLFGRPIRFRFIQYQSDVIWALDHFYVGPTCLHACSGHGNCEADDGSPTCVCDQGHKGDDCHVEEAGKVYLKDTFNNASIVEQWSILEGDNHDNGCGQLIDGLSLSFNGIAQRQAETVDLDLRDSRFVQYRAVIGSSSSPESCIPARNRSEGILLQYSSDGGITWALLRELVPASYSSATRDYVSLPLAARTISTRLRWWQPLIVNRPSGLVVLSGNRAGWAIDDVYIGGHDVNAVVLDDDMEGKFLTSDNIGSLDDETFDFHPNGVVGINMCGSQSGSRLIMWPGGNELSLEQSLTTRQLIVSRGYMIQFKIKVGCTGRIDACSRDFPLRLQYREEPLGSWQLIRDGCYPNSPPSPACPPFIYHHPSIFTLHRTWAHVTIPLDDIESETAQFRWYQEGGAPAQFSWAIDDVYVGAACPRYCSGHGRCGRGPTCRCEDGFEGFDCSQPLSPTSIRDFKDDFEHATQLWEVMEGGEVGYGGCGALRPHGFGRSVYFSRCGERKLRTVEMDLRKASYVQYVIQIGMLPPRASCHVTTNSSRAATVLLEYTTNNGVTWSQLKEHRADFFAKPKRAAVKLPPKAKSEITSLRWWQLRHNGAGEDQWAVDNVEIIMSRVDRHIHNLNAPPPAT